MIPMLSYRTARRDGLSIMEVLFAIGVLMIGLLGIASILPVAGRNAANALRSDAAAGAVENQVNHAAARLTEQLTHVDVPNHSQVAFRGTFAPPYIPGDGPYSALAPQLTGYHVSRGVNQNYYRVDLTSPPIVKPAVRAEGSVAPGLPVAGYRDLNFPSTPPMPIAGPPSPDNDWLFDPIDTQFNSAPLPRPAFCVDPSFVTAASNLRNDTAAPGSRSMNGYDRSMFPCYDLNYNPQLSPGVQVGGGNQFAMTPRMHRVAMPTSRSTAPANVVARAMFAERDVLPLVRPDGELRDGPPGLLVRPTGATAGPTTQLTSSRFSTMIMLAPTSMGGRDYEAHIVVFEARQTTINPPGTVASPQDVFNLQPYGTSAWANETAAATTRTYGEEVLGIVESASSTISGGVGVFTYVHSADCNPEIGVNDWILLCRWIPDEAINRYAWYRVSDVISAPTIDPGPPALYRTTIEVRGGDWLFHPSQVITSGAGTGTATGYTYSPPGVGANAYNRRVTTIVKMPSVISVRTMNVTF